MDTASAAFRGSLFAGLIFGLGLLISAMADPARVPGFLTPLQRWNPTLAFVMSGALAVAAPLFALARRDAAWIAP